MELHTLVKDIEAKMIEVPAGIVTIGENVFHVETFKISKLPVTEHCWGKVMGDGNILSRKSISNVSMEEISDFLQRLSIPRKSPGQLTIPTEAQILLAQQGGYIRSRGRHKGLRLVLVDYYMTRRQVSTAIVSALELSEYSSVYKRDRGRCLIYFVYSGDAAQVCQPGPNNACMMIVPDLDKDDTITVSTDIVRLPREMDPDTIMDRLIRLNDNSKKTGIRYEAPWLYHADADMNRVLYVIKEFRALSDVHIMVVLPEIIKEFLTAVGGFNKLFYDAK